MKIISRFDKIETKFSIFRLQSYENIRFWNQATINRISCPFSSNVILHTVRTNNELLLEVMIQISENVEVLSCEDHISLSVIVHSVLGYCLDQPIWSDLMILL
jgi:hypothetical protein